MSGIVGNNTNRSSGPVKAAVTTKGVDIASASTLVIGEGGFFDITGTTGITAMTVDAGRRFTLQFDGAVTLTHGSSLYLPGATNFTTEANDCLSFIATAANTVRCTGYALKDGGSPVAPSGGAWAVLSSGTVSGASELVITGLTKTSRLYLQCVPGTDGAFMILKSSTDGGSSYASSYSFESSTNAAGSSSSLGQVSAGVGNASGENLHLTLDIFSPATSHHTMFESSANHSDVGGQNYKFLATNTCLTAQSTNAIKLYFSSSATMTGSYTVIELN